MKLRLLIVGMVLALVGVACGGGSGDTTAGETATTAANRSGSEPCDRERQASDDFPLTIEAANGTVELARRPVCIISLSPSSTEILFAVGAGDQVLAVDKNSDFPVDVPKSDLDAFTPNVEAIARLEPDLVVISDDIDGLAAGLRTLEIPVIHHPAVTTLEEAYTQMEQLGQATGNNDEAAELVREISAEIEEITADVPDFSEPPTYFHELDDQLYTITSNTFIGQIYELAGLTSIGEGVEAGNDYPQLSAEFVIESDPDLIFLADAECCQQSIDTIATRPGWGDLSAVKSGRVVELDEDVSSRWGPRVVEFLRVVVDAAGKLAA